MALFQSPFCSPLSDPDGSPLANELRRQEMSGHRRQINPENNTLPGSDGRQSSTCTQVVWIFFWLAVLIVFAYPVALLAGILYALLNPLSLINCSRPLMEILLKCLNLPLSMARNMVEARQLFET